MSLRDKQYSLYDYAHYVIKNRAGKVLGIFDHDAPGSRNNLDIAERIADGMRQRGHRVRTTKLEEHGKYEDAEGNLWTHGEARSIRSRRGRRGDGRMHR